jgi:hypothetical protein
MSTETPETPVAATPPTPENVAEMLTAGDNDYHDGNYWHPSIYAEGNVVHIGITAYADDDEGTKLPEVHFRAVVVEVPAYSVAAEPVTLPVETARELAYGYAGDDIDGWTVVVNEYVATTRWSSTHRLVIRNEAGEHFADIYRRGLTENQERRPYEDVVTATFSPVVPRIKVVTEWEAAQAQTGGASDG